MKVLGIAPRTTVTTVSIPCGTASATSEIVLIRISPPGPVSTSAKPGSPSVSRQAVSSESTSPSSRTRTLSGRSASESTSKLNESAPRRVSRSPPGVDQGSPSRETSQVASSALKLLDSDQAASSTPPAGISDRMVSSDTRIAADVKLSIATRAVSTNTESGIALKRPSGLACRASRSEDSLNAAELGRVKPQ